jgi:predicted nucleic acid-binding Zn ribbon protein
MPERRIADILSELQSRRGYARVAAGNDLAAAWRQAAGEAIARQTRVGTVRRGVLEVMTANSMLAQELQFQKERIVARLTELLPEEKIRDVRCKVGPVKA